jgi:hypothetical protein
MSILKEKDGTYSWRKILTALAGIEFFVSCMFVQFGADPLPAEYLIIISGVILSYFIKKRIGGSEVTH